MTAQNMAKKILADSGYEVTTVSNGAAAVKKIAEVKPDLVILDIYMPGYTGLEVCERVRANLETTHLPVLLTVGKMEPYRPEDGARVKADGIIVKPFEATDLLGIVKKISDKSSVGQRSAPTPFTTERVAPPAVPAEETAEPSYEEKNPQPVEVPAEMAAAPVMDLEDLPGPEATAPIAVQWAPSPVEVAAQLAHASPAIPMESAEAHAEAGTVTDSIPAYVEPETNAPSFEIQPLEPATVHAEDDSLPAPLPEIEFSSAPQVEEIRTEQEPELEPTVRHEDVPVLGTTDPALVISPEELAQFATSFGVQDAEEIPVGTVTGNETFLADPNVESPEPETLSPEQVFPPRPVELDEPTPAVETHDESSPEPVVEAVESTPTSQAQIGLDDFEARVAAAMSAFDLPLESGEPEPVVEQVDNFIGDPEIVNPVGVESIPSPASASTEPARVEPELEPEEVHEAVPEKHHTLDVNETMVLPAEALLSLEAEMRKALELKQAAALGDVPPTHEQVMDDFTGPQKGAAPVAEEPVRPEPSAEPYAVAASASHGGNEFTGAVPAALHPEPVQESKSEGVPDATPVSASSVVKTIEHWGELGEEKLAGAVHKAIERLKPQLIAEIVKALKGEE